PSSMGGDVVRGYYSAGGKGTAAAAFGAVLAERLAGFAALAAVCAVALIGAEAAGGGEWPTLFVAAALLVCAGIVACCGVMFLWTGWSDVLLRTFGGRPKAVYLITELSNAMQFMRRPGCRVWRVVYMSVLVQIAAILFFLFTARAVGIALPAVSFFVVVPLAVIASMVPVSLNGLGLREGAFVGLLQLLGVAASVAGAFALLARLVDFVVAAIGGLIFAFRRPAQRGVPTSSRA
ncbi:MAG: flippase-like domain-containing protein, partial [Gammaproteobacteria bacterium]|nr:flippase-like domain-containing protein [Gammaproteobacteria bacterium]